MKKAITIIIFLSAVFCLQAQDLSWDIRFQKVQEVIPISQIIRMQTGEVFRFSILPGEDAFCYIILYDSQRQVSVLHDKPLPGGAERNFGQFALTEPSGTETIYVIMSVERQVNLENLILNFNRNPKSRQHSNNLYREVVALQNTVSRLGEPASSYIPSGGTARGAEQYVTRFSGNSLYVRAITIRH